MAETERRHAERRHETTQISMIIADSQVLEGKTVNLSATGVLLQARGSIHVFLNIRGQQYSGRLVRGFRSSQGRLPWRSSLTHAPRHPDRSGCCYLRAGSGPNRFHLSWPTDATPWTATIAPEDRATTMRATALES